MTIRSVFLSCGTHNRKFAHDLVISLELDGVHVWYGFNRELERRTDYWDMVQAFLNKSTLILAILSDEKDKHVFKECAGKSAKIIVVEAEKIKSREYFANTILQDCAKFDLSEWAMASGGGEYEELLETIKNHQENEYKNAHKKILNPAHNPDFFDTLRILKETLSLLRDEIAAINDPDRLTADVRAVRAYIESFLAFLDNTNGAAPDEIPAQLPEDLGTELKGIDWSRFPEKAQKWAEIIGEILKRILS